MLPLVSRKQSGLQLPGSHPWGEVAVRGCIGTGHTSQSAIDEDCNPERWIDTLGSDYGCPLGESVLEP